MHGKDKGAMEQDGHTLEFEHVKTKLVLKCFYQVFSLLVKL
jgi:hypothetical protein